MYYIFGYYIFGWVVPTENVITENVIKSSDNFYFENNIAFLFLSLCLCRLLIYNWPPFNKCLSFGNVKYFWK